MPQKPENPAHLTRRDLLKAGGITVLLGARLPGVAEAAGLAAPTRPGQTIDLDRDVRLRVKPIDLSVVRPEDMLLLDFRFINLTVSGGRNPGLVKAEPMKEAYLAVRFPIQAIAEEAYFQPGDTPLAPPVPSRAAGYSWLAFRVPPSVTSIPYTLEGLLDWSRLEQVVVSGYTDPTGVATSYSPFTTIEAPYRLFLSPSGNTGWAHALQPVTHNSRTELWHTSLALRSQMTGGQVIGEAKESPAVNVIWSPDSAALLPESNEDPENRKPFTYRAALPRRIRRELVRLGAGDWWYWGGPPTARRLMLTSLGAWLKLHGEWNSPRSTVTGWTHEATMGRDHFVRYVERGHLYPLGHLASLVTETERKIESVPGTTRKAAYLRQKQYIVVQEQTRTYPGPESYTESALQQQTRKTPFRSLTVLTERTPDLDAAGKTDIGSMGERAYWPAVRDQHFPFRVRAVDWEDGQSEWSVPLVFIKDDLTPAEMSTVLAAYNNSATAASRTAILSGQRVAYARKASLTLTEGESPGDVVLETESLMLSASGLSGGSAYDRPYWPELGWARIRFMAVDALASSGGMQRVTLHPLWTTYGFDPAGNPGYVFLKLADAPQVQFAGDKVGGLIRPDMRLDGLSFRYGLVGGNSSAFGAGTFDPADFLQGARILGGITLADILNTISLGNPKRIPQIKSEVKYKGGHQWNGPEAILTTLSWEPEVKSAGPFLAYFNETDPTASSGDAAKLKMKMVMMTPVDSTEEPSFTVENKLTNFTIDLAKCIRLGFAGLNYTGGAGKSPDVKADLRTVTFGGPLAFVQKLQDLVSGLTGDLFAINVQPSGVQARMSLPVPMIAVGVFSLQNLSISAGIAVPLIGDKPTLFRFAFCERQKPFTVTVGPYGGGGFLAVALGLSGLQELEAALEFGGSVALSLGVANGSVSVMAGVYFGYKVGQGVTLEGYLRARGQLRVLKVVTISAVFYLSLTYQEAGNKVWGQASLTVEVEVWLFSASVTLKVERQFSGDENDPPFSKLVEPKEWQDYTEAFAEEVPA